MKRLGVLPLANSEEILAVIPNEEAILAVIWRIVSTHVRHIRISQKQDSHPRTRAEHRTQQARQAERLARYEHITALFKQGMKSAEIATQTGMTERTVRRWLSDGAIPYSGPRKPRPRLIDPYKTYLLSRWHEGSHKGAAALPSARMPSKRCSVPI